MVGSMEEEEDSLHEICSKITQEKDSDRMIDLVRQLNQEFDGDSSKSKADEKSVEPKANSPRAA